MLKTLSVSEVSFYITKIFEAEELLQNIKIYGEVSNLSFVRNNLYFNLKDENSLLPCIMFGASSNQIKEGDQILATGSLRYYAKNGKLNFYATTISPYGSGILYQKFIELKNRLEEEGVFDKKFKKELPKSIKTIGVITSKSGAVLQDIITVSQRRNPFLNIVVYPAKVQGEKAENSIINGLKYFDSQDNIDIIIIARGGGSIEDLQPFNSEVLARQIIKCFKPVISAVGHETDFTICDFASSIRAATPSVAAELVAKDVRVDLEKIKNKTEKLFFLISNLFDNKYEKLDNIAHKIIGFASKNNNADILKLRNVLSTFDKIMEKFIFKIEQNLLVSSNKLFFLNPITPLKNGWAKVRKGNSTITRVAQLEINDDFEIEFIDGKIKSKVMKIEEIK